MLSFSEGLRQLIAIRQEVGLGFTDSPMHDPDSSSCYITPRYSPSLLLEEACRQPDDQNRRRERLFASIRERLVTRLPLDTLEIDRALGAMRQVPRELFVPNDLRDFAYLPTGLEIGYEQTISSPHLVAAMTAALGLAFGSRVLDVGTGSGYHAAVMSKLVARVTSVEIVRPLAVQARRRLADLGISNVEVLEADGAQGLARLAPFDAILVAAGADAAPPPLIAQLAPTGKLVMPVGPAGEEELTIFSLAKGVLIPNSLGPVSFVPLTGQFGRQ